jgi:hypothetical protein
MGYRFQGSQATRYLATSLARGVRIREWAFDSRTRAERLDALKHRLLLALTVGTTLAVITSTP